MKIYKVLEEIGKRRFLNPGKLVFNFTLEMLFNGKFENAYTKFEDLMEDLQKEAGIKYGVKTTYIDHRNREYPIMFPELYGCLIEIIWETKLNFPSSKPAPAAQTFFATGKMVSKNGVNSGF